MICPYCHKDARWCENKEIYGRNYGKSYMCYYCKDCNAYVGCHNNTKAALGTMANEELRGWRKKAHATFDPIWQYSNMSRQEAYGLISEDFGFEVHIGEGDIETCQRIIEWANKKIVEVAGDN